MREFREVTEVREVDELKVSNKNKSGYLNIKPESNMSFEEGLKEMRDLIERWPLPEYVPNTEGE